MSALKIPTTTNDDVMRVLICQSHIKAGKVYTIGIYDMKLRATEPQESEKKL